MTLIGHWLFDEAPNNNVVTAIDVAAGGSGAHDGSYQLGSIQCIRPGGVNGRHGYFYKPSSGSSNYINTILNEIDFKNIPILTVSFWIQPIQNGGYVMWCAGPFASALETDNTSFQLQWTEIGEILEVKWEHSAGTLITTVSNVNFLTMQEWQHIAIVRKLFGAGPSLEVEFWNNGVLINTDDNTGAGYTAPTGGSNGTCEIARRYTNGHYQLDSLRVYDSNESANIPTIYAAELAAFYNEESHQLQSEDEKTSEIVTGNATLIGSRSGRDYGGFTRISV